LILINYFIFATQFGKVISTEGRCSILFAVVSTMEEFWFKPHKKGGYHEDEKNIALLSGHFGRRGFTDVG
jgi:hypothetical protein